jgi:hypothetical protein
MNYDNYKNTKPYPSKSDYMLWRLSIIDAKTEKVIHNIVTEFQTINSIEDFLLEFFRERIDSETSYVEYSDHVLNYKVTNNKILEGHRFRYKTNRKMWKYPKEHVFYLRYEKLNKKSSNYDKVLKTYQEESQKIYNQFKKDFFSELGIENNPKKEIFFSKVWEEAHSSGYENIMNCAYQWVDLID